jgi:hypothetical protein
LPTAYKILGQAVSVKNTETTVYTVPSATSAVVSSITVTNISASGSAMLGVVNVFSIIVRPAADSTTTAKHYVVYKSPIATGTTRSMTYGLTLAAGDKVILNASSAYVSISVFGSEIS